MDPFDWILLAVDLLIFWVPLGGIVVASVLGFRGARRRGREGVAARRAPWLAGAALLVSLAGLAGGLLLLSMYAVGSGLGGYTPPAEELLLQIGMLTPAPLALLACAGSLAWLVQSIAVERRLRRVPA